MSYYERIIELITEANADSRKRSYEIAKKHGLLGRGDNEFVDLPSGRQGVRNPGRRGKPGTGEGGSEQFVTDDDGEYYPYRPEENAPRRKKRRVKESVDSINERKGAAFARRQERKAKKLEDNPATAGTPKAKAARNRATTASMNRYAKQAHRAGVSPDDIREFARKNLKPEELRDPISSERLSRARYIGSKAADLHSAGVKRAQAAGTFGIPRKKKRVKESVDSVSEANFKRSQRQYRSKNPEVQKKGAEGLVRAGEQQALRGGEVSPREVKLSQQEPDLSKKMFMKKAVIFAADRARREPSGKLKSLRQFEKKPNK